MKSREIAHSPPAGYWSVIYPNPMHLGRDYTLRVNFPPVGGDVPWMQTIRGALLGEEEVTLSIRPLVSESFKIMPDRRDIIIPLRERRLPIEFLITPSQVGTRRLRLEVHIKNEMVGWFDETIRVKVNIEKWLALTSSILGLIAIVIGILDFITI